MEKIAISLFCIAGILFCLEALRNSWARPFKLKFTSEDLKVVIPRRNPGSSQSELLRQSIAYTSSVIGRMTVSGVVNSDDILSLETNLLAFMHSQIKTNGDDNGLLLHLDTYKKNNQDTLKADELLRMDRLCRYLKKH